MEFKDKKNNRWQIALNIGEVMRIKSASAGRFNLFDPDSLVGEASLRSVMFTESLESWGDLYELLWLIVEPQATAQASALAEPITALEFAELMADECLMDAASVLRKEWRDFFRRLQRHDTALTLEAADKYQEMAIKKLRKAVDDPQIAEMDRKVEAKMDELLNKSFGSLQAELDSILALSPGDNSGT